MFTHFKNDSIRKLVVAFGSLFNNIQLEQTNESGNSRLFTVPLTYGPKEKFIKRLTEPSSISDKTRIEISLPRMSFELLQMAYDPIRKFNKTNKTLSPQNASEAASAYAEVPYNFAFGVNVYTRNLEENLQIIEQILPYFSPEFVVSLNMNTLYEDIDVPISIGNTSLTQEYEGDFSTRRFIVSTFQFIAKSYIYGKISTGADTTRISTIKLNIADIDGITFIPETIITQ
jgi:T4-like virus Myoviridae tail sheath stabiliser